MSNRARKIAEYDSRLLDELTLIYFALSVALPAMPTHQSTKIANAANRHKMDRRF